MTLGFIMTTSLLVGLVASSASAESSRPVLMHLSSEGQAGLATPAARAEQRALDRVFQKFVRGRISARTAARRIADHLDEPANSEGVYGIMFKADSTHEEEKVAELMEELKRVMVLRARLLSK